MPEVYKNHWEKGMYKCSKCGTVDANAGKRHCILSEALKFEKK